MAEYVCEECSKSFDSEKALSLHTQQEHSGASQGQYKDRGTSRGTSAETDSDTVNRGTDSPVADQNIKRNQKGGKKSDSKGKILDESDVDINNERNMG